MLALAVEHTPVTAQRVPTTLTGGSEAQGIALAHLGVEEPSRNRRRNTLCHA